MRGRQAGGQERLFYSFNLEDHVPRNHLLRGIGRCLDLSGLHDHLADRWFFDSVVRRCMAAGLVKGEGFAVDASVVAADANRQRGVPGGQSVDWNDPALSTRAVREYLEALDAQSLEQVPPKNISLTDPLSRWTVAPGGPAFYA